MLLGILAAVGTIISGALLWSSLIKGELRLGGSKTLGPKTSRIVGIFILPVFLFLLLLTLAMGLVVFGLTLQDLGIDLTGGD
ncbi:MAG: hypothetical protein ACFCBV_07520 [Phycisphaerales bacterium]|mgnify:CR=1 FL=1|nr:hypothetical protein [Phycisphaerales bacterium]